VCFVGDYFLILFEIRKVLWIDFPSGKLGSSSFDGLGFKAILSCGFGYRQQVFDAFSSHSRSEISLHHSVLSNCWKLGV